MGYLIAGMVMLMAALSMPTARMEPGDTCVRARLHHAWSSYDYRVISLCETPPPVHSMWLRPGQRIQVGCYDCQCTESGVICCRSYDQPCEDIVLLK